MHPLVCQCSGRSVQHRCFCWSRFSFAGLLCLTCGTTAGDSLIKRCAKLSSSCNGISHVRFKYSKTDRSDARSLSRLLLRPCFLIDRTPRWNATRLCVAGMSLALSRRACRKSSQAWCPPNENPSESIALPPERDRQPKSRRKR